MSDTLGSISTNIPTSFVKRPIKLIVDKGNGEAKLYIGATEDALELEKFFSFWDESNTYMFDRQNLLMYLDEVSDEYLRQDKYKQVSKDYHRNLIAQIINSSQEDLEIDLTVFSDAQRVYIRSKDQKKDFWESFRMIALPLISELEIVRNQTEYGVEYWFYLWRSDSPRIRAHTRRGTEVLLHPDHTRYISAELKRKVWQRDKGMCRANWTLDPRLDKVSQETCDSNVDIHYDHIKPYSKGGLTTLNNLQILCQKHNLMKSDKELY